MTRIGCVVLAAGFSNRLGEEKALLETGDGALVGWITKRLSNQGIHPVVVTRGDILDEVEEAVKPCNVFVNPSPEKGRTGSIKIGISALDEISEDGYRLIVVPVDRPGFSDSTISKLTGSMISCCPSRGGRGGHPILLSEGDVEIVRNAPKESSLRSLVESEKFEVGDPFLHLNVDTQKDMEDFKSLMDLYSNTSH